MKTEYAIYAKMANVFDLFQENAALGHMFWALCGPRDHVFSQMLPLTTFEFETLVINFLQPELLHLTYSCVLEEFTLVYCSVHVCLFLI
jgi:hypothetical protein